MGKNSERPVHPSLLQDLPEGGRKEVDFLNDVAIEKGKRIGIPKPVSQDLLDLAKEIEEEIRPKPADLDPPRSCLLRYVAMLMKEMANLALVIDQ